MIVDVQSLDACTFGVTGILINSVVTCTCMVHTYIIIMFYYENLAQPLLADLQACSCKVLISIPMSCH